MRLGISVLPLLLAAQLMLVPTTATASPSARTEHDDHPAALAAAQIMTEAKAKASEEHKHILTVFSASWCGPCKLFEGFLNDPAVHPIMDRFFVVARFDVGERPGDTRHADTPGGVDLRASLGGADAGYPFIAILNGDGRPIVDSLRPDRAVKGGANIGYPDLPVEIDWFMHMLQQAAPALSASDASTIRDWLQRHAHSHT